jgi:RNA polymerase sigma factor (sigma-70 family)
MNQLYIHANACPDEHILLLIQNKDDKGYTLLYEKYWTRLVNYTYGFVEEYDTAKEIVQTLLVSFFTNHITVRNKFGLHSYLQKSIRNRVANHYRNRHNYIKHLASQKSNEIVPTEIVTAPLYFGDLQKEIRRCLCKLPKKYTEVFILNREHYFTVKEIARELNRPEGTVEKQLRKTLQFLKENLDIDLVQRK